MTKCSELYQTYKYCQSQTLEEINLNTPSPENSAEEFVEQFPTYAKQLSSGYYMPSKTVQMLKNEQSLKKTIAPKPKHYRSSSLKASSNTFVQVKNKDLVGTTFRDFFLNLKSTRTGKVSPDTVDAFPFKIERRNLNAVKVKPPSPLRNELDLENSSEEVKLENSSNKAAMTFKSSMSKGILRSPSMMDLHAGLTPAQKIELQKTIDAMNAKESKPSNSIKIEEIETSVQTPPVQISERQKKLDDLKAFAEKMQNFKF